MRPHVITFPAAHGFLSRGARWAAIWRFCFGERAGSDATSRAFCEERRGENDLGRELQGNSAFRPGRGGDPAAGPASSFAPIARALVDGHYYLICRIAVADAERLAIKSAVLEFGELRHHRARVGQIARTWAVTIIRDWVLRFNARGPDGLLDGKSPGQPSKLNDAQRQAIAPIPWRRRTAPPWI
jgi:hypothetical protein